MFFVSAKVLATLRHYYLGFFFFLSFFWDPEDFTNLSLRAIWNFTKMIELPWNRICFKEHKVLIKGLSGSGSMGAQTHCSFVHSFIADYILFV
jgi:hypothetical protein